jgi:lysophospholipase L1-like esterase
MDVWNHEADVLSILVGINDVWHETLNGNGVDAERFEAIYRMLIADTIKRYPNMKIVMMEPFVTKCSTVADNWLFFHEGIQARAKITKKIAEEMGVIFLPLQNVFDDACNTVDAAYWANDGIHPSPAGHQLIADAWIDMFEENVLNK